MSARQRRDFLRLARSEQIGPVTFHRLIERFGDAGAALAAIPQLSGGRRGPRLADAASVEAELEAGDALGLALICAGEPAYPAALAAIADAPPALWVAGDTALFSRPAVAIVGARNASAAGRRLAAEIAADLGAAGLCVVSGLARGIDGAAHQAALTGGTIAVVAGGVDVIYPPEHAELTRLIAERGAVVSERPVGYRPTGRDFPRRNRIISGLSRGVIVVEAAERSGTLISARYAAEQGRDVFAIPGSPLDPRCHGTNRLIRDGAILTRHAEDVIEALGLAAGSFRERERDLFDHVIAGEPDPERLAAVRREIASLLGYTPVHRDVLMRESGAPPALVADALVELVLSGEVEEHTGGRFSLHAG